MSFARTSSIPVITKADLVQMNALVKPREERDPQDRPARPLQFARSCHRKILDRYMPSVLKPSALAVLSAIGARTMPWNKVLEVIPLDTFTDGLPGVDSDGLPYFAGININKSTIRTALDELAAGHFIERFAIQDMGRTVYAYMPMSALVILYMTMSQVDWDDVPESIRAVTFDGRAWTKHEERIIEPLRPKDPNTASEAA